MRLQALELKGKKTYQGSFGNTAETGQDVALKRRLTMRMSSDRIIGLTDGAEACLRAALGEPVGEALVFEGVVAAGRAPDEAAVT